MVKRKKQIITSPYGTRGEIFHKGVDLRCYNFFNWKKQPIVFPEQCRVIRVGYQEKWGFIDTVQKYAVGITLGYNMLKAAEGVNLWGWRPFQPYKILDFLGKYHKYEVHFEPGNNWFKIGRIFIGTRGFHLILSRSCVSVRLQAL